jgi:chemotaxis protein MotB
VAFGQAPGVMGRADTVPMFPDNPYVAPNRRVTITLLNEAPPIAPEMRL